MSIIDMDRSDLVYLGFITFTWETLDGERRFKGNSLHAWLREERVAEFIAFERNSSYVIIHTSIFTSRRTAVTGEYTDELFKMFPPSMAQLNVQRSVAHLPVNCSKLRVVGWEKVKE